VSRRVDTDAMRENVESVVEVALGVRVPLHIDFDLMRNDFFVCWDFERHDEYPPPHVKISLECADLAQFGRRAFSTSEEMDDAARWRRVIARVVSEAIARTGVTT
jgi:hypothetical protein